MTFTEFFKIFLETVLYLSINFQAKNSHKKFLKNNQEINS